MSDRAVNDYDKNARIRLTNSFTVACGGKLSRSHNTLVGFVAALKTGRAYASHVAVGTLSGEDFNVIAVKTVTRNEYNYDPSHGELFAVYTAEFADGELADGAQVSMAALRPAENGIDVNRASFAAVTKVEGEPLVVRIELRLSFTANALALTAGNNALVSMMLGHKAFTGQFYVSAGLNHHPTAVMTRSSANLQGRTAATAAWEGDELVVTADMTTSPYECVLSIGSSVVARSFLLAGVNVNLYADTLRVNSSAERKNVHVIDVMNIKCNGTEVARFRITPCANRLDTDCVKIIDYDLTPGSKVIGEPCGTHMIISSPKEIAVYKFKDTKMTLLGKIPPGEVCDVTQDGVVITGGKQLSMWTFSGGVTRTDFTYYSDVKSVKAISDDGVVLAAITDKNGFHLVRIEDGNATDTDAIKPAPSDLIINKHDWNYIDYASKLRRRFKSAGIGGNNVFYEQRLLALYQNANTVHELNGRWCRYTKSGVQYFGNIESDASSEVSSTDTLLYCGNYAFHLNASSHFRTYQLGGSEISASVLDMSRSFPKPTSVALLGDYVVEVTAGGKVTVAYLSPYGVNIYCPLLESGSTISYSMATAKDPMTGGNRVRMTYRFNFGGG